MSGTDEAAAGNLSAAATPDFFAAIATAHSCADELRPGVHPDNSDNALACALTALGFEVRALALAVLLGSKP